MEPLNKSFDERLQEIEAYLDLLDALQRQVQTGPPTIGGATITAQQQKILYSSVYLQLYNLVEATATWCIDAVASAAANGGRWKPGDLSAELRREWVRVTARTHTDLNYDHRLQTAVDFFSWIIDGQSVGPWGIEKGGGGNWDDSELERIAERLGVAFNISDSVKTNAKRFIRDDMSTLKLVKFLRNKLAHGSLSFTECGENVTVAELRNLTNWAADYLREVIKLFQHFIDTFGFLQPAARPAGGPL